MEGPETRGMPLGESRTRPFQYVITNNVITTAGSAGAENSKLLYSKKPANVEEAIPSQVSLSLSSSSSHLP